MSNYCNYAETGILLNKSFDDSSTPTSTQVTAIITEITGEIDVILSSIGIASQPTDTNILAMLKKYCRFGSAGIVSITYGRNMTAADTDKGKWYYDEYMKFLERLREDPELLGVLADTDDLTCSNHVLDGTYTEEDMGNILISSEEFEV